jgi:PPK2 family polyphosphate:nucleotide phosphotransferase
MGKGGKDKAKEKGAGGGEGGDEPVAGRWRVAPGSKVQLDDASAADRGGVPEGDLLEQETAALHATLIDLQGRLWAEHRRSLLVVLQAIDAGGKDGTIRKVFSGLNPTGTRVASFKRPSDEELDHDFLWRVHAQVPRKGEVVIFNRSHYEDVIVTRVHQLVDRPTWERRYGEIRDFEQLLVASDTTIVKLFLHISKEEQRVRLQTRVDDPAHRWKFSSADLPERALWGDYRKAFEGAIAATSTKEAPWYVIPADHKKARDWIVARIMVEALQRLDPQYPPAAPGVEGMIVQ